MDVRTQTLIGIIVCAIVVAGCAAPMQQTDAPMITYDNHTKYSISPRAKGFSIAIYYSRYQFIPESNAVAVACKSALTAIAYEHAEEQGRNIQPINEQRIRISMGRNGFTGITSCSATAIADWQT